MYKKLFGETIIYGVGAILPRLVNFLLTREFTQGIDEAEFAIFTNLYAAVSIINVMLTFGFETSYFRFSNDKKENTVFSCSTIFLACNAFLFLGIIYLFLNPIASFSGYENQKQYLLWFAWIIFFDTLCVIPYAWLRYHNKPIKFSATKLTNMFISVGLTLVFLRFYLNENIEFLGFKITQNVAFPFVANLLASIVTFLILLPIVAKTRLNLDLDLFKKMIHYSFPVMLAGLAFTLNENFDKLIQKQLIPDSHAGAYGACYKLAALMTIFVTAFRMGVEPFLFKQMNDKDVKKTYATVLEFFTIAGGLVIVGILGNIAWLQDIFIRTDGYKIALGIVPIIIIANLFFGIYNTLSIWYKVNDKTYIGSIISWIGAGLTIVINLIFIPIYGFMASAWATVLVYGIMMLISYFWGQKSYRIPYKSKKIVLYMTLAICLGLTNYYALDKNIFSGNITIILYIGIIYFLEKDHLIKELKK